MEMETRVARLERELRRSRWITVLLLIALAALLGYGAGESIPEVLRAKRFEMVDDAGRPLLALRPTSSGGAIGVFSRSGNLAAVLTADETGGGLLNIASAGGGNGVLVLGSNAEGTGGALTIFNGAEKEVVTLRPDKQGRGVVGAWDAAGKGHTLRAVEKDET